MKKQIKLAVAAVIMFGSLNAMADVDEFEQMHQFAIINTVQLNKIDDMIKYMDSLKEQADLQYQMDGVARVGDITKLTEEAIILSRGLDAESDGVKIDAVLEQVKGLTRTACKIANIEQSRCQVQE